VRVDGLLHLVGGWRGGGGLRGQTEADYRALESGLSALRHVTRACWDDLNASPPPGRRSCRPRRSRAPGGRRELRRRQGRRGGVGARDGAGLREGRARSRVARRPRHPSSSASGLAGLEEALGSAFVGLWDADAAEVNDTIVGLGAPN
jgi:hypothetical protein